MIMSFFFLGNEAAIAGMFSTSGNAFIWHYKYMQSYL